MALLIGLVLAFFVVPPPWNVAVVAVALGLEVVEVVWGLRLARGRARTGAATLVGRSAVVVRALAPEGQVMLGGERWQARCEDGADEGERVVVRGLDRITLLVEREG
jgi:membrane-bound serine protease (ClpP class)